MPAISTTNIYLVTSVNSMAARIFKRLGEFWTDIQDEEIFGKCAQEPVLVGIPFLIMLLQSFSMGPHNPVFTPNIRYYLQMSGTCVAPPPFSL